MTVANTGAIRSHHRTLAGAVRSLVDAERRLSRIPGMQHSYTGLVVRALVDGEPQRLSDTEREAAQEIRHNDAMQCAYLSRRRYTAPWGAL